MPAATEIKKLGEVSSATQILHKDPNGICLAKKRSGSGGGSDNFDGGDGRRWEGDSNCPKFEKRFPHRIGQLHTVKEICNLNEPLIAHNLN